jgi:hypothetical protein
MIMRLLDMTMLDFSLWEVLVSLACSGPANPPIGRHTKGLNGVEQLEPTPPEADTMLGIEHLGFTVGVGVS